MQTLIFLPFFIQAIAIGIDEYYFHIKRGLPKWERIGHPLDTLSFIACLVFVLFVPYEASMIKIYVALAILSCLMITKDEFVHKHHCPAAEQWLHALLFVNHSVMLTAMGLLWPKVHGSESPTWVPSGDTCHIFLWTQAGLATMFFLYQIIYWNFVWKDSSIHDNFCLKGQARQSQIDCLAQGNSQRLFLKTKNQSGKAADDHPSKKLSYVEEKINNDFYEELGEDWIKASAHPIALLRAENRLRNPWLSSKLSKRSKCLDIGCGAGFLTNDLAAQGHEVFGIDLSEKSLAVARRQDKTASIQYLRGDATSLPFEENSFDAVAAMDILEHVENPAQIVREAARVLKPGGLFFFHTFNKTFWSWLLVIKGVEWCVANTPKNMHLYSCFIPPEELKEICKNEGLIFKELKGVAPRAMSKSFWKMLLTRRVPDNFEFKFSSSLLTGYSGMALKEKIS